jgi:hypothetical protein
MFHQLLVSYADVIADCSSNLGITNQLLYVTPSTREVTHKFVNPSASSHHKEGVKYGMLENGIVEHSASQ